MSFLLSNIINRESGRYCRYSNSASVKNARSGGQLLPSSSKSNIGSEKPWANRFDFLGVSCAENLNPLSPHCGHGLILTTESDSVMEFSILSNSSAKRKFNPQRQNIIDYLFENENPITLKEVNDRLKLIQHSYLRTESEFSLFLSDASFRLVPQIVQTLKLLNSFHGKTAQEADSIRFIEIILEILQSIWLPYVSYSIGLVASTMAILDNHEEQEGKMEETSKDRNPDAEEIFEAWQSLNHFPMVLLSSLKTTLDSDILSAQECKNLSRHELTKKIIVTSTLEMSRAFSRAVEIILSLNMQSYFPNDVLMAAVEKFLDCTVQCRAGEIMIGIDTMLEHWIACQPRYIPDYHHWARDRLATYLVERKTGSPSSAPVEDDEQDLMFNKWEIGILFLREIQEHTAALDSVMCVDQATIGWLTVFNDDRARSGSESEPAQCIEVDLCSLPSLPLSPLSPQTASPQPTKLRSKAAAVRDWMRRSRLRLGERYRKFVQAVEEKTHLRRRHVYISSIRCYSGPSRANSVTASNLYHMQRLTHKLYKKERRGRRKRDAIRVIFDVT